VIFIYTFLGKPGKMYEMKLNYKCEFNGQDNKCEGLNPDDSLRGLIDKFQKLTDSDSFSEKQRKELSDKFSLLISSGKLSEKSQRKAERFLKVVSRIVPNSKLVTTSSESINIVPKKQLNENDLYNISSKLSSSEKNTLYKYTIPDSDEIETSFEYVNKYANNISNAPSETKKSIKVIDDIMNKSIIPDKILLYKGVSDSRISNILNSGNYKPDGFVSTSIDKQKASEFGEKYILELNIPKGTKGVFLGDEMSNAPEEKEVLLNRGYVFKVVLTKKDGNKTIVSMNRM